MCSSPTWRPPADGSAAYPWTMDTFPASDRVRTLAAPAKPSCLEPTDDRQRGEGAGLIADPSHFGRRPESLRPSTRITSAAECAVDVAGASSARRIRTVWKAEVACRSGIFAWGGGLWNGFLPPRAPHKRRRAADVARVSDRATLQGWRWPQRSDVRHAAWGPCHHCSDAGGPCDREDGSTVGLCCTRSALWALTFSLRHCRKRLQPLERTVQRVDGRGGLARQIRSIQQLLQ